MPKAVSVAEELINNYKDSITGVNLVPSGGGVFEVEVDGQLIFSKKALERFPEDKEVSKLINEKKILQGTPE